MKIISTKRNIITMINVKAEATHPDNINTAHKRNITLNRDRTKSMKRKIDIEIRG